MRLPVAVVFVILLTACGQPAAPEPALEVPEWARVAPEQVAEAKKHGVPVAFENEIGMRFVLIPAGTHRIATQTTMAGYGDGGEKRRVAASVPFYLQTTEVTNAQYREFDPFHRSQSYRQEGIDADSCPAWLTHAGARHLALWLSTRDSKRAYRLPTVSEWLYASVANQPSTYWFGNDRRAIGEFENLGAGSDGSRNTVPVGSYPSNPWGLHDMLGNVSEWCGNWRTLGRRLPPAFRSDSVARCGDNFTAGARDLAQPGPVWSDPRSRSGAPVGVRLVASLPETTK